MSQLVSILHEEIGFAAQSLKYLLTDSRANEKQKVLVNGSPKTGTTWMYRMISSIPGYAFIGNFEGDIKRYHDVKPGGVVHGHEALTPELEEILRQHRFKVILMIRDPRDQVISRVFHFRRSLNSRWNKHFLEMPDDQAILACIEGFQGFRSASDLITLTKTWLDENYDILCIKYEDLNLNPHGEFKKVIDYLGLDLSENYAQLIVRKNRFERLTIGKKIWKSGRKAGQDNPNSHFRKGVVGDWHNYFKEHHKERFKEIAGASLIEFGYEQNYNW